MIERGRRGMGRIAAAVAGLRALPAAERQQAWSMIRRLLATERVITPDRLARVLGSPEGRALADHLAPPHHHHEHDK